MAHEQEPREGLARTPKGDRVGITSPTDTEFDRKDKDAHPSPRGLAAMYISVRTGPTAAACIRLTRERRAGSDHGKCMPLVFVQVGVRASECVM